MYGILRERLTAGILEKDFQSGFHYCSLCHGLRINFGSIYGMLTNWECRILALLVDAQSSDPVKATWTRCPARGWFAKKPITANDSAIRYASCINLLMFAEKMEDNLRDDNSSSAKHILRLIKRRVELAKDLLIEYDFPVSALYDLRNRQIRLENGNGCHEIDDVTLPSGLAVSLIVAHTARIGKVKTNYEPLLQIGLELGKALTIIDACKDYKKDAQKRRFNAIAALLPENTRSILIPWSVYQLVENYLYVILRRIRHQFQKIELYRQSKLVQNILYLGLFDAAKNALCELYKEIEGGAITYPMIECDVCGHDVSSLFCSYCGHNRYGFA